MTHEEEQIESLKRFWQDYGTPLLVGFVLAIAVFVGWTIWQKSRLNEATRAAGVYQELLSAVQRSQLNPDDTAANTDVQRLGKTLKDEHASTPYAVTAGLLLARQAADRNDLKEAEKQLRWVLDRKPAEAERLLATTRLARVLAAGKQYDAALALLEKEHDAKGFQPTIDELRGDIFQAQGKIAEARAAYEAAAKTLQARDERRPLLDVKMADVGLAPLEPKKPAAKAKAADTESSSS
ncbi:MAG TPA: tetratricopeptide repeat protein [Moraxellaceae bacterium]|nr:tetratricopeptide repeat protein [Moraxellaceae bacterium]